MFCRRPLFVQAVIAVELTRKSDMILLLLLLMLLLLRLVLLLVASKLK